MRILPVMPPDEGYEPSSVELNHEEGILEISETSQGVVVENAQTVAETLVLRCHLQPIPRVHKAIKIGLISEGETLEEMRLYDEISISSEYTGDVKNAQWQGIALKYDGVGRGICQGEEFLFYGETLPTGHLENKQPLYFKPFRIEDQRYQVRVTTLGTGQVLTSPPGVLNTRVLRGYGGYYHPGVPLDQIEQVYYSVIGNYTQTQVRLYTSSALQAQHTPPPHGGRDFGHEVMFDPSLREEEYFSLAGALAAGYARLMISTDWGTISYSSYLCKPTPGYSTFVDVYFRS